MALPSPYARLAQTQWLAKTRELLEGHPLNGDEIVDAVLAAWNDIFECRIGRRSLRIGRDLFPAPQILGFLLHELIAAELAARHPEGWRRGTAKGEKDLVHLPNDAFSVEIKTSSNPAHIFGNRSYAQEGASGGKFGYYLAVNFAKWATSGKPAVRRIRFGWLDHSDWIAQRAPTGQQARLTEAAEKLKLLQLFSK